MENGSKGEGEACAASRWTEKAALIIAHFECHPRPGIFRISAAFAVPREAAHRESVIGDAALIADPIRLVAITS